MACGDNINAWVPLLTPSTFNLSLTQGGPTFATALFTRLAALAETTFTTPSLGLLVGTWDDDLLAEFFTFRWTALTAYPYLRLTALTCNGSGAVLTAKGKMFEAGDDDSVTIWGTRVL